jgi:hypothetical protein
MAPRVRRYRIAGLVILLLGFVSAAVVYWVGTHGPNDSDDPAMLGFNRAQERQMGVLYGKQGQLVDDFTNVLKEPGTQAILIVIAGAVVAAGCFFYARMVEDEAREVADSDSPRA